MNVEQYAIKHIRMTLEDPNVELSTLSDEEVVLIMVQADPTDPLNWVTTVKAIEPQTLRKALPDMWIVLPPQTRKDNINRVVYMNYPLNDARVVLTEWPIVRKDAA